MQLAFRWVFEDDNGVSTVKDDETVIGTQLTTTDGYDSNEANELWYDQRKLTVGSTTDLLDLFGSLTNRWGRTVWFRDIKGIVIYNRGLEDPADTYTPTTGQDLLVGGAGAGGNAWGALFNGDQDAKLRVKSGMIISVGSPFEGFTVTPNTGDILKVEWDGSAASGGDVVYDIAIIGTTW